ncbi:MAG: glycoside hydrolase family 1 protein [Parcubacteria group bacterium]|nr:glycoside hydrolase family 1 protein [Parcubacteria group bacterium]MCR4342475.1 glycoside hydrolase family 1 protein [Patescibacteria group bacterium]
MKYKFPENFLWGSATASHQVEGGNVNDWSIWEKKNADRLAKNAKKKFSKLPNWESIKEEAENPENYISGKACDHYNRYEEDFDIVKSLGQNAFRFSIEWSRIEPEDGRFDEREIWHYRKVVKALRARGIEPFVTLWHWPLPVWLKDKGGWRSSEIVDHFGRYTMKMAEALGADVKFWITLNEPLVYATHSYLKGAWPPQKKNPVYLLFVIRNLVKAHRAAYKILKEINKDSQVGISKHNVYFDAYKGRFLNRLLKNILDWAWNFSFLNSIKNYQDFIGLNNYHHNRINYGFNKNDDDKLSDMGWELYPDALYYGLLDIKKYNKPIYITENGLADREDRYRAWFIEENLKSMARAMGEGLDVRGYLYWSLLDNFEWDKGFWPRFGLVEIDYKTLERKIRPSAHEYAKICKTNEIEV